MSRRGLLLLSGLCLAVALRLMPARAEDKPKGPPPFNGVDFKGWKYKGDEKKSKWVVGHAALDEKDPRKVVVTPLDKDKGPPEMIATQGSVDIYTEETFGDCTVEVEVMVPKGSNSGIYLMGQYEVQVIDSYGKKGELKPGDMGGIYETAAPKVNAAKKPGEWQKFVIEFQAPRFEGKKKTANGKFLKVTLNGEVIHENVEVTKPTGGQLAGGERAKGPLMFQGDHGPIAFRNLTITPK
jgi:Domain of Unknown Function (DUF1080)